MPDCSAALSRPKRYPEIHQTVEREGISAAQLVDSIQTVPDRVHVDEETVGCGLKLAIARDVCVERPDQIATIEFISMHQGGNELLDERVQLLGRLLFEESIEGDELIGPGDTTATSR